MDFILFWGLVTFILVMLFIGIPYLIFFIFKKFGFRKTGKKVGFIIFLIFCCAAIYVSFEDYFFFKFSARKELKALDLELTDDFEILKNESGGFTDYYHIFELKISDKDTNRLLANKDLSDNSVLIKYVEIESNVFKEVRINTDNNILTYEYVIH